MDAVKGMLPKTSLGRKQLTKLKVFVGNEHTHEAQKPEVYSIYFRPIAVWQLWRA